jgi:hypothetical protein
MFLHFFLSTYSWQHLNYQMTDNFLANKENLTLFSRIHPGKRKVMLVFSDFTSLSSTFRVTVQLNVVHSVLSKGCSRTMGMQKIQNTI